MDDFVSGFVFLKGIINGTRGAERVTMNLVGGKKASDFASGKKGGKRHAR
ncbi:MAG: hypothetical protein RJAPGHWK_003048, partial [Candidatus Fervidibacter sp.]